MVLGRLLLDDDPDMSVYHFQKAKQLTEQQQDQAAELGFRVAQFEVEYMEIFINSHTIDQSEHCISMSKGLFSFNLIERVSAF